MKYPIFLSLNEIDIVLDALADYNDQDIEDSILEDHKEIDELRMTIALARRELFNRLKVKKNND